MRNVVLIIICLLSTGIAKGSQVKSLSLGTQIDNPMSTAPGNQFELDFNLILGGYDPPHPVHNMILMVGAYTPVESFKFTLDYEATVYSFAHDVSDPTAFAINLYNPEYIVPTGGSLLAMEIPTGWLREMEDGILSGRFWIEGAQQASQAEIMVQAFYVVPEPASVALLGYAGGMYLLNRRKKNRNHSYSL